MRQRGVALNEGRAALAEADIELWWRSQTTVMLSGTDGALPRIHHQSTDLRDIVPPDPGRPRAVFGVQSDAAMESWARRHRMRLLLPDSRLTDQLGDKTRLPELAGDGRACLPPSMVVEAGPDRSRTAAAAWRALGGIAVVVQRGENNLTGAGTRVCADEASLARTLSAWSTRPCKVSALQHGIELTVSGCVIGSGTAVSGVSHQLVGLAELTDRWGAHCGNQLVDERHVGASTLRAARAAGARMGERLRRRGWLGLFGLDLLATAPGRVLVLELNPRIQSVTSLLNYAEAAAGLLPLPGVHLLAHLDRTVPPRDVEVPVPTLAQLVVTAPHPLAVTGPLPRGRYRVDRAGALRQVAAECGGPPPSTQEALVWPAARRGSLVERGDRLFVVMLGRHVAAVEPGRPRLSSWASSVLTTLRTLAAPALNRPSPADQGAGRMPRNPAGKVRVAR